MAFCHFIQSQAISNINDIRYRLEVELDRYRLSLGTTGSVRDNWASVSEYTASDLLRRLAGYRSRSLHIWFLLPGRRR